MITISFSFSEFAAGGVDGIALTDAIADAALPPLLAISTFEPVGQEGTAELTFDATSLTTEELSTLSAVVAAHDSDAAPLLRLKAECKAHLDLRTNNAKAIRTLAQMTDQDIELAATVAKAAVDAATDEDGVAAAVAADTRPQLDFTLGS